MAPGETPMHPLTTPRCLATSLLVAAGLLAVPSTLSAEDPAPPRGFLGVSLDAVSEHVRAALALEEGVGVLIRKIVPGGAAEEAGLQEGDVVVAAQGRPVRGPRDLVHAVGELEPADVLSLELWRHGRVLRLDAVLQESPEQMTPPPAAAPAADGLGLTLLPLTDQLAEYFTASGGVLVAAVGAGSPAEVAGLLAGDVVVAVDGREVEGAQQLRALLMAAEGPTVLLGVIRNGADISIRTALDP